MWASLGRISYKHATFDEKPHARASRMDAQEEYREDKGNRAHDYHHPVHNFGHYSFTYVTSPDTDHCHGMSFVPWVQTLRQKFVEQLRVIHTVI